jgi:ADP-heptose:LPS heptosyltransferase
MKVLDLFFLQLKNLTKKIFDLLYYLLAKLNLPAKKNRILLVKLDLIGDYILFRNFIEPLVNSKKYNKSELYLLCNSSVKELASELDYKYFKKILSINPYTDLNKYSIGYLRKILYFKFLRCNITIHPSNSRTYEVDEFIGIINTKQRISSIGDNINFLNAQLFEKSKGFYTKLLSISSSDFFEFEKNKTFFKLLLHDDTVSNTKLFIDNKNQKNQNQTIAIVIGASKPNRIWSAENFQVLIELIEKEFPQKYKFLILGTQNDSINAVKIKKSNAIIEDLTGKTTVSSVVTILKNANCIITHDTGPLHIAAALGVSTICISNGNQYGRFIPYPNDINNNIRCIFPWGIHQNELLPQYIEKYKVESTLNINSISAELVFDAFKQQIIK